MQGQRRGLHPRALIVKHAQTHLSRLKMSGRIALLVVLLLVGTPMASAMDIRAVGNTIILSGPVVGDELARVGDAFVRNPSINQAVLRNSWGGDAWTGYRVGELFREKGITTLVSGHCVSSCSRMFLGGKERHFTDDFPAERTFVGFHGHYAANGRLDAGSVRSLNLFAWILRFSDGKADEGLVRRWISIERNTGAVNFLHPDIAPRRESSVYFCQGDESNRPLGCAGLPTNALDRGVITDIRRISSPDKDELPHVLRAKKHPPSNFAEIDNPAKVPLDNAAGISNYRLFLASSAPRAFAVSATRQHWAWNTGSEDVSDRALQRCAERAGQACKLYAVDDAVVYWP